MFAELKIGEAEEKKLERKGENPRKFVDMRGE